MKCFVLLFRQTQNKVTLGKVGTCATSIILADLAKGTGIDVSVRYESGVMRVIKQNSAFLCRK